MNKKSIEDTYTGSLITWMDLEKLICCQAETLKAAVKTTLENYKRDALEEYKNQTRLDKTKGLSPSLVIVDDVKDGFITKTQEEITDIETKANALLELGEVQKPVEDYIELLQETIMTYQGELYSKNSDIGRLEFKVKMLEEAAKRDSLVAD